MEDVYLAKGAHRSREEGMCAMEFAAYLAGLEHTSAPSCVSRTLGNFMIRFNDSLRDEPRQRLRPYIVRSLGTRDDGQDEKRVCMIVDFYNRMANVGLVFETMSTEMQESGFRLLDRMIDPAGIHDLKTEAQWLEQGFAGSQEEERLCRTQQ